MPAKASVAVEVEGLAQLRRTLRQAGDDLSDLKDAHQRAAYIVGLRAESTAPRRTGRLAGSVKGRGTKNAAGVTAGSRARVPYAPPIHWGWFRRGISANPWVSRAAQDTEPLWLPAYSAELDDIVAKVKGTL